MESLSQYLSPSWQQLLGDFLEGDTFKKLDAIVLTAYDMKTVYPPKQQVFAALNYMKPEDVKVVILGQDPYHGEGQANGLSFSVQPGVKLPPSLQNIFKERTHDIHINPSSNGDLSSWAEQGVLLLNTVLTVTAHEANSHRNWGWEQFTDEILKKISKNNEHIVFILWGKAAQNKQKIIDTNRHTIICAPHPSPLSAYRGFFDSAPFSKANEALIAHHQEPIDWDNNHK